MNGQRFWIALAFCSLLFIPLTSRAQSSVVSGAEQYNLGRKYEFGQDGVTKDDAQAASWFRKAAEQGNPEAQNELGFMYSEGRGGLQKDKVQSVYWYRKAAEQGNALGQSNLGINYQYGTGGLPQDPAQAVSWFRKAADQGDAQGQASLAFMYVTGTGVQKDESQAAYWFRKAAEQGDPSGQFNLGKMYAGGRGGLARDDVQAAYWFRKSAEQGVPEAQGYLGSMYEAGRGGLPEDIEQALYWYRKAAAQGDQQARTIIDRIKILREAMPKTTSSTRIGPLTPHAMALLAEELYNEGKIAESNKLAGEAAKREDDLGMSRYVWFQMAAVMATLLPAEQLTGSGYEEIKEAGMTPDMDRAERYWSSLKRRDSWAKLISVLACSRPQSATKCDGADFPASDWEGKTLGQVQLIKAARVVFAAEANRHRKEGDVPGADRWFAAAADEGDLHSMIVFLARRLQPVMEARIAVLDAELDDRKPPHSASPAAKLAADGLSVDPARMRSYYKKLVAYTADLDASDRVWVEKLPRAWELVEATLLCKTCGVTVSHRTGVPSQH